MFINPTVPQSRHDRELSRVQDSSQGAAATPASNASASRAPVFLVGCPRSGTTFLASLLEQTPWGAPFETHFVTKYAPGPGEKRDFSRFEEFRALIDKIRSERPFQQWGLELDDREFFDSLDRHDYATIIDRLCKLHTARLGYESWGDKTPHYILDLDLLHELWPESKFLVIVRDGRDVALSLLRKPWGPGSVEACARYWRRCHESRAIVDGLRSRGLLFELHYEDLLARPAELLREVLRFLGENPERYDSKALTQGVVSGNFGKWRQQMSATEIETLERVAADVLREHGYPSTHQEGRLGFWRACREGTKDLWKRCTHQVRQNFIEPIQIRWFGREPFAD